nr:unnamed protein product [Callosobruchus analis]
MKLSKIRQISWYQYSPNRIEFKYKHNETARFLNLQKSRRSQLQSCCHALPSHLLLIESKKLNGLLQLCKGPQASIPKLYQNFLFSLTKRETVVTTKGRKIVNDDRSDENYSQELEKVDSDSS